MTQLYHRSILGHYQLRVGVPLGDVGMLLIDFREVVVDRQREQRVPVSPHEVHLDLLADVELLPGDRDDAETDQRRRRALQRRLSSTSC